MVINVPYARLAPPPPRQLLEYGTTVTLIVAGWLSDGLVLVAVTVVGYDPGDALHESKVRVAVAEPPAGTVTAVEPAGPPHPLKLSAMEGEDDAERVTVPLKPLRLETVIVEGQHVYWFMLMELGLAEMLKSGQFTTLTTTLGV
jgi:hypothetical protein